MTTTTLQKILMAFIIIAAAWFALRYRQSNYEPPESTVTVTPPPAIQGAPSGDQPAAIAPAPAAPEAPAPMATPEAPMAPMEDIGGIGAFNTIAGETMYDFDPAPPAAPPVAEPMAPEVPMAPPAAQEAPMAPPAEAPPMAPPATTGTEMYMAPPPEHSLDGEIEMYTRSGYAEI
jgi:hypothetical protein